MDNGEGREPANPPLGPLEALPPTLAPADLAAELPPVLDPRPELLAPVLAVSPPPAKLELIALAIPPVPIPPGAVATPVPLPLAPIALAAALAAILVLMAFAFIAAFIFVTLVEAYVVHRLPWPLPELLRLPWQW